MSDVTGFLVKVRFDAAVSSLIRRQLSRRQTKIRNSVY